MLLEANSNIYPLMKTQTIKKLNAELLKDLPNTMDIMFGKGEWVFDEVEKLYIGKDKKYQGKDFGFIAVREDGTWFTGARPFDDLTQAH